MKYFSQKAANKSLFEQFFVYLTINSTPENRLVVYRGNKHWCNPKEPYRPWSYCAGSGGGGISAHFFYFYYKIIKYIMYIYI
jgi:hypothetical protein